MLVTAGDERKKHDIDQGCKSETASTLMVIREAVLSILLWLLRCQSMAFNFRNSRREPFVTGQKEQWW